MKRISLTLTRKNCNTETSPRNGITHYSSKLSKQVVKQVAPISCIYFGQRFISQRLAVTQIASRVYLTKKLCIMDSLSQQYS